MVRKLQMHLLLLLVSFIACQTGLYAVKPNGHLTIVLPSGAAPRLHYGAARVSSILKQKGYQVSLSQQDELPPGANVIIIGCVNDPLVGKALALWGLVAGKMGKEGFSLYAKKNSVLIAGNDNSGALYGCLELVEQISNAGALPSRISMSDQPEMLMRGACVGLQKPYYLPGRTVYEYPYTPATFPWFYNKQLWLQYLDSLAFNRMNTLYLWNGHPFASLVKLKDYPYAVEVDDVTFKKNEEMYRFLTAEADKRGIWVIQMFYNIIVSKPFAEKHNIKTQDRERHILPLIADYTRKSIAAFVQKYPNVGLLITLGEAMEGVGKDDVEWFTKTIIPGVQDGMLALGRKDEPPIILRAHDTDAPMVMEEAKKIYSNLYTMAKYNGEALTTYTPRGPWAALHRKLSGIGTVHIENVHILANLEPFRYGSADFIQKCVKAMHDVYGANGLHLYPQASFWDWPWAADSAGSNILQVERDWIWYKEWARYAWNCHRNRNEEVAYWSGMLAAKYGCSNNQGKAILEAYEQAGEIAPKLLRRYGITDGNRQTLTLGMQMSQLVNPARFGLFTLLYNSEGPEGEMISEYVSREWNRQPHTGETPVQVMQEVKEHGEKAVEAINKALPFVTANKDEFNRLKNDMYCYHSLAMHYAFKVQAAIHAMRYKYSGSIADLEKAVAPLRQSVAWYDTLTRLTQSSYRYANSMQTQQRKIPFRGVDATFKTWKEILPFFEKELVVFKQRIDSLKVNKSAGAKQAVHVFTNVEVDIQGENKNTYLLTKLARPFSDSGYNIEAIVPELGQVKGLRMSKAAQQSKETTISFVTGRPVKLLVGYFNAKGPQWLAAPELETNAAANNYGQAEAKITNAVLIEGLPPVNVHSYSFKAGQHTLVMGKGAFLVLGFIADEEPLKIYDAALQLHGLKEVDWLFE